LTSEVIEEAGIDGLSLCVDREQKRMREPERDRVVQ